MLILEWWGCEAAIFPMNTKKANLQRKYIKAGNISIASSGIGVGEEQVEKLKN